MRNVKNRIFSVLCTESKIYSEKKSTDGHFLRSLSDESFVLSESYDKFNILPAVQFTSPSSPLYC